jgi:hypothetical protein
MDPPEETPVADPKPQPTSAHELFKGFTERLKPFYQRYVKYNHMVLMGRHDDDDDIEIINLAKVDEQLKFHGEVTKLCDVYRDDILGSRKAMIKGRELFKIKKVRSPGSSLFQNATLCTDRNCTAALKVNYPSALHLRRCVSIRGPQFVVRSALVWFDFWGSFMSMCSDEGETHVLLQAKIQKHRKQQKRTGKANTGLGKLNLADSSEDEDEDREDKGEGTAPTTPAAVPGLENEQ